MRSAAAHHRDPALRGSQAPCEKKSIHPPSTLRDNGGEGVVQDGKDEGRMDRRAENERRQEALWRVFLMFLVLALVLVRAGVLARSNDAAAVAPCRERPKGAPPAAGAHWSEPAAAKTQSTPAEFYRAVLVVLALAETAGRLFVEAACPDWELMKRPAAGPRPGTGRGSARDPRPIRAGGCKNPPERLDTS